MKKIASVLAVCIVIGLVLQVSLFQYYRILNQKPESYYNTGYSSLSQLDKDIRCLADNIYMEAGIESIEGKLAVAAVTMNRVNSKLFENSVCGVVYSKYQFSWTMNNPKNQNNYKHKNWEQYQDSITIAKRVIIEKYTIPSLKENVLWYHADYIDTPVWAKNMKFVCKIGRHKFYSK